VAPLPRERTQTALSAHVREAPLSAVAKLKGEPLAIAVRPPEVPEDALFVEGQQWRFGAYAGGEEALAGDVASPEELVAAVGDRPVAVHDAKSLRTVPPNLAHDTLLAAYLIDPAGRAYPFDELCADRGLDCDVADEVARDAILIHTLSQWQREALRERDAERLLDEVELPLVHVLREMELAGVKLDTERLAAIAERVNADAAALEREIHELAGEEFTIGSPQQLSEVLFVKLGLSRKRRGKTGYSTDARVLQAIRDEHEIIPKIERWRELTKLASTYLEALPALIDERDGRLHTTFNQTATTTGRLSSTDPNLQNIPIRTELGREIRACFVAEPGNLLVSADYSQVELRVLAHIAGEEALREIFARGEDVHTATAGEVLGLGPDEIDPGARSKAKMINYGIVYGLSGFGLADRLQIEREEADAFIERYLDRFPAVREFIDRTIASATTEGYVTTLFGRRRRIPELRARNRQVRQLGERLAVNTVIQGSAADIIKVAMVRAHRALAEAGLATRLVLQIHDELLFEGPAEEAERAAEIVRAEMEGAYALDPPLAVDLGIGPNWLDAK
jgi:DNA polymerase-1